ncbi:MAG TPA: MOSC N-terminal beta barrel domain-containing protein, partial [Gemmatimonadaceae bacterium]
MPSREIGKVAALFRYPVKSMAAESLDSVDVGWNGFTGDRRWAFVRGGLVRSGFPWLTIRESPEMWHYQPRFEDDTDPDKTMTLVRTPDGDELEVVDPALANQLGHDSQVIRQSRGIFDTMPLSLITTQTIAALEASVGEALDMRRFRPNLVVESL